ncbi:MAG TPA: Ig-like domain-containing protein, partial [Gemmatimonadales bacterium]|nr:Ig-like domain-containing protein [Gemmatimonadales bacterium]
AVSVVDQYGVTGTNGPVVFRVNRPPAITLSSPTNTALFAVGASVPLRAVAADADGTIEHVSFLANGTLVGTVSNSPFQLALTNLTAGHWAIQARAVDDVGDAATSSVASVTVYLPPPNDQFAQRSLLPLSINRVAGNTMYASAEPNEPGLVGLPPRQTLWWSWVAPFSARAFASTRGSDFDTLLAVFVGDSLTNLNLLAVNNNETTQMISSRVEFQAVAGANYHFVVDGTLGQAGAVRLTVGPVVRLTITNGFETNLTLHVSGATNVTYILQQTSDLSAWRSVQTNVPAAVPFRWVEPKPGADEPQFYRILLEP